MLSMERRHCCRPKERQHRIGPRCLQRSSQCAERGRGRGTHTSTTASTDAQAISFAAPRRVASGCPGASSSCTSVARPPRRATSASATFVGHACATCSTPVATRLLCLATRSRTPCARPALVSRPRAQVLTQQDIPCRVMATAGSIIPAVQGS